MINPVAITAHTIKVLFIDRRILAVFIMGPCQLMPTLLNVLLHKTCLIDLILRLEQIYTINAHKITTARRIIYKNVHT